MKRIILLTLIPTAALAHEGNHAQLGFFGNLHHLLSEPDHLAMLATATALVAAVLYFRKGRAK